MVMGHITPLLLDVSFQHCALALVTIISLLLGTHWLRRSSIGPRFPSCDFETFYWAARKRLGRKFATVKHCNRASADGVKHFAWAVPNKEALACIARYVHSLPRERRHIVDFGAGAGYWSMHVNKCSRIMSVEGVRVTAMDKHPELYEGKTWHPILQGDLHELASMTDVGMLLLIWPPCWEDMAAKALDVFAGELLAYVGEAEGGATAWHTFFKALTKEWVEVEHVKIPNWHGRSDGLFIYQRRSAFLEAAPAGQARHQHLRHSWQQRVQVKHNRSARRADLTQWPPTESPSADAPHPSQLLLPFFRGTGTDTRGRSLAQIREYGLEQMELVHDYIQWVFPTDEESMFNMHAPLLTHELQQAFKDDAPLRDELRSNLTCFCHFLGLELRGGGGLELKIVRGSSFHERVPDCWSAMFGGNHNWLRISRVLHCLGLSSLPDEQHALMACLEEIFDFGLAQCSSAMPHWRKRASTTPSDTAC